MNYTVLAYFIYLPVAIAMTVWVARTLHQNGRVFLLQAFRGREDMADSVNLPPRRRFLPDQPRFHRDGPALR